MFNPSGIRECQGLIEITIKSDLLLFFYIACLPVCAFAKLQQSKAGRVDKRTLPDRQTIRHVQNISVAPIQKIKVSQGYSPYGDGSCEWHQVRKTISLARISPRELTAGKKAAPAMRIRLKC